MIEPGIAVLRTRSTAVKASVMNLDTASDASWFTLKTTIDGNIAALEKDEGEISARL